MKYSKWINKNTSSLENKKVFFVGATGSIGLEAVKILLFLHADLTIGARNIKKAEKIKDKLLEEYPDAVINIEEVDVSSLESIDSLVNRLNKNNIKFDIFYNNAGVYHLPASKTNDGLDITFETNTVGCIKLVEKMIPLMNDNGVINVTSSISYRFHKLDMNDIGVEKEDNKLKKYGLTKRAMLKAFLYVKEHSERKNLTFNLVHPGICATELFNKSHGKMFMTFVFPLMKIIFHSPLKASLSIVEGSFVKTNYNEWVGPRGLFNGWGYPSVSKLNKDVLENTEPVYTYIENIINK